MTASRLVPSYCHRAWLRARTLAALRGLPGPSPAEVQIAARNWEANRGAQVMPADPAAAGRAHHWNEIYIQDPSLVCHPVNAAYIDRFLKLAASRRIPVIWLVPPILGRMQTRREILAIDAAYMTRVVLPRVGRFPNVTLVDGRHAGYGPELFVDAAHLDRRGAVAFSEAVADLLRRPSPGRWVELPPPRPTSAGMPLEDLRDSTAIVQRQGTLRR
jgi:hypothetical protein